MALRKTPIAIPDKSIGLRKLDDDVLAQLGGGGAAPAEHTGHEIDADTVALWKMNEESGTAIADEMGSYDLTASSASVVTGRFGNCREFNGGSSFATGNAASAVRDAALADFTWEGWIYLDPDYASATGNYPVIHSLSDYNGGSPLRLFAIYIEKSTRTLGYGYTTSAGAYADAGVNYVMTAGVWVHVAFVKSYDSGAGTNTFTLYINGGAVDTSTGVSNPAASTNAGWRMGNFESGSNDYFKGKLDDVRLSAKARTADEVLTSFTGSLSIPDGSITEAKLHPDVVAQLGGGSSPVPFGISNATSRWHARAQFGVSGLIGTNVIAPASSGTPAVPSVANQASIDPLAAMRSTTTSAARAGYSWNNIQGGAVFSGWNPRATFLLKYANLASIANYRICVGMSSANELVAEGSIAYTENEPGAWFRYSPSPDGDVGWVCCTSSGGGTLTAVASGVAVTNDQTVRLSVHIVAGTRVDFYIDDTLVHSATTNIPAVDWTQALGTFAVYRNITTGGTLYQYLMGVDMEWNNP